MGVGYIISIICFILCFYLPESPVFLIQRGRLKEAEKALQKIAKMNGKELNFNYADF